MNKLVDRRLIGNYFSRSPLNQETFFKRIELFQRQKLNANEDLLIDCVRAARQLQEDNKVRRGIPSEFFHLRSVSNKELDDTLWKFMNIHKNQTNRPLVLREYFTRHPRPSDISRVLTLMERNFQLQIMSNEEVDSKLVSTCLNTILENNDYPNSFRLLDLTYGSQNYLTYFKRRMTKFLFMSIASTFLVLFIQSLWVPVVSTLAFNSVSLAVLLWGFAHVYFPSTIDRVSWRPHQMLSTRVIHNNELILINKIITYFEEHREINTKNFHHSEVRDLTPIGSTRLGDYIIELSHPLQELGKRQRDNDILKLQQFFRDQMRRRFLVLHEMPEELVFLDYWLNKSEKFVWFEPDQDPSEIVNFKIQQK